MTKRLAPEPLPPGNWRLDPFKRIVRYVPDQPYNHDLDTIDRSLECEFCGGRKTRDATKCRECYNSGRRRTPTRRLLADKTVREDAVAAVIGGSDVWLNRAERVEVVRRWAESGRPWLPLVKQTGWNVHRYRRWLHAQADRKAA